MRSNQILHKYTELICERCYSSERKLLDRHEVYDHVKYFEVRLNSFTPSSRHARVSVVPSSDTLMSCVIFVFPNSSQVSSLISSPKVPVKWAKYNDWKCLTFSEDYSILVSDSCSFFLLPGSCSQCLLPLSTLNSTGSQTPLLSAPSF